MDTFDRIATLLQNNHMTQADLARATGISTGLISQWKKRAQNPSSDKLQLISEWAVCTADCRNFLFFRMGIISVCGYCYTYCYKERAIGDNSF